MTDRQTDRDKNKFVFTFKGFTKARQERLIQMAEIPKFSTTENILGNQKQVTLGITEKILKNRNKLYLALLKIF